MLDTFRNFLADGDAENMYITGRAGTGKTTKLAELVQYCINTDVNCIVSAHTHKALGILESKMPPEAQLMTLHAYLGKCPTINGEARTVAALEGNMKTRDAIETSVIFVDEWSMVGERDVKDMPSEVKKVWIGDPYQLGPVKDKAGVKPEGDYQVLLTKIYRQADGSPLIDVLEQIVGFIEGGSLTPIKENASYLKDRDIAKGYNTTIGVSKAILCFTNHRVEDLNKDIQGYSQPKKGDLVFSGTTQKSYTFMGWESKPTYINDPFDPESTLELGTKFRTLEHLKTMDCRYAILLDEEEEVIVHAVEFGTYQFKLAMDDLKQGAVYANSQIDGHASRWSKSNPRHPNAVRYKKAWRNMFSYKNNVICLDFIHAMTVHKSQGSTFDYVFLDAKDIHKAADINMGTYLQLMYVGISRASQMVITN